MQVFFSEFPTLFKLTVLQAVAKAYYSKLFHYLLKKHLPKNESMGDGNRVSYLSGEPDSR